MAAPELVVRRLRVVAGRPQMAARVEDALRTSAKPAALLHRHVIVRRLRLRAPPGASSSAIARQLERAWREIEARARPIEQADDADDVVWAPSEAAARAALIVRWARGEAPVGWFWARIAEPAGEGAWPQRALRLMLTPASDHAEPVRRPTQTALLAVLGLLWDMGVLERVVLALTHEEARHLFACIERDAVGNDVNFERPYSTSGAAGRSDAAVKALLLLQSRLAPFAPEVVDLGALVPTRAASSGVSRPHLSLPRGEADLGPAAPTSAPQGKGAQPSPAVTHRQAAVQPLAGFDTPWAGLWLLLPILLRQGLEDDDSPLAAFAQALQTAPERFGIPIDDPVRDAIASLELPGQPLVSPWLRRARVAAVREVRLPLRRIAHRHGQVHVSDTRIDVAFPADAADVRIRRAGFDLDPGFVPWLGRVVHFHYA